MGYLIDSDVVTDYLSGYAISWVESLVPAGLSIRSVTYMEAFQGTLRSSDTLASQMRHAESLENTPVLPFTEETALRCANLRHVLWSQGRRVRSRALDLMIAATAIEHGLTLVTRNRTDYGDIPELELVEKPLR